MPTIGISQTTIYFEEIPARSPARPTIVFLHDGLGSVRAWRTVPAMVAERLDFNAVVYDRRGYGRSSPRASFPAGFLEAEAGFLEALLDHLGLDSVHLVGHSDGATIALLFAAGVAAGTGKSRSLSVFAEAPHTFVEPESAEGLQELLRSSAGRAPDWMLRQHADRALSLLVEWTGRWLSPDQKLWDIRDSLSQIICPVLVAQGEQDEYATLEQVNVILERVRDSESWVISNCGHTPHAEYPGDFVDHVVDFVRRVQARGGAT